MTYSENLQARAEEMAKEIHKGNWDKFSLSKKLDKIMYQYVAAIISLQNEAKAYKTGYIDGKCDGMESVMNKEVRKSPINDNLQSLGLIEKE